MLAPMERESGKSEFNERYNSTDVTERSPHNLGDGVQKDQLHPPSDLDRRYRSRPRGRSSETGMSIPSHHSWTSPDDHLFADLFSKSGSASAIMNWLTERVDLLPLIGTPKGFIADVTSGTAENREKALGKLIQELLSSPEQAARWAELQDSFHIVATEMIDFWQQHGWHSPKA